MRHEAELVYSVPLLRSAVAAYWKRAIGIAFPLALTVVAGDLGFLVVRGDRSWIVGALATIVALAILFAMALYAIHYGNVFRKLREMGAPKARFIAEESTFTVESEAGRSTLRWSSIKEVWRFRGFWLLLFSKAHFMTIPLAGLTESMREFVLEQVRACGGKID